VALVLHLPLAPTRLLDWLRVAFLHGGDYDDADAAAIVPIDLDLLAREPAPEPAAPAPPPVPAAPSGEGPTDAGAPPARSDAGAPLGDGGAPRPPASSAPDAGPTPPRPVEDPMGTAGGAGKISAKDPNVQLLLSGKAMRKHPLGGFFSRVLLAVPQWRDFFGGTPVDPIRDLDHILITAPRLRGDTGRLVAVMSPNLPAEQVEEAVGIVVRRAGGVWLETEGPVTSARAQVGGASRLFAILPQKKLLVVLPGDAMEQLERLKQAKPFRNSAEALVVSLLTPARPFGAFFPLPNTLKWMRIALVPTADGGADVAIDAGDRSPEDAERDAVRMTAEMERRRKIEVPILGTMEILDAVTFEAAGDVVRARTHVSRAKLSQIMAFIEGEVKARVGDGGAR
jgi:hypothetical protein